MKNSVALLAGALLLTLSVAARAGTTDDVITLTQRGVGDGVLLAMVENSKTGLPLSAADVVRLKENKVSEKIIVALIRRHNAGARNDLANVNATTPAIVERVVERQRAVEVATPTTVVYRTYPAYSYVAAGAPYYYPSLYSCYPSYRSYGSPSHFSSGFGYSNYHGGYRGGYRGGGHGGRGGRY